MISNISQVPILVMILYQSMQKNKVVQESMRTTDAQVHTGQKN